MKINDFINVKYSNNTECIKALEMKPYLPIAQKKELAHKVVTQSVVEEDGYITIDEIAEYIYMVTSILSAYTNLEFSEDFDELMCEFDLLVVNKKLVLILNELSDEYKVINDFVNMEQDRMLQRNNLNYQVARFIASTGSAINAITEVLTQKIEGFDINNWGITEEQAQQFVELLNQFNMN